MYGRAPQGEYRLADKLRREYRNRGEDLRGIGAASTEELMARAQMGRDPRENVSEEAFSDRLRNRNYTYDRRQYTPYTGSMGGYRRDTSYREASRPDTGRRTRPRNENRREDSRKRQEPAGSTPHGEVQIRSKGMPVGYLVMLAVITMMIITILFSIAQVYQTTNTIDDLEKELSSLQTTASELELAIEEKNDIRVIEQIATDQLGMVKEDSVQRKYISLSDGERIDIIGEESDTVSEGVLGTMLSSIAAAFAGFFENLAG
ncbi:MAG: septum formation initiator family protein [Clostridia bacterium]|nr:septum formation initiator family protein [Clostridia bacterium]